MNNTTLKLNIQAHLNNHSLTQEELDELLLDCLIHLKYQENIKNSLSHNYKDLLSNAKQQTQEAHEIVKNFNSLADMIKNLSKTIDNNKS